MPNIRPHRATIYRDRSGKLRYRVKSGNGQIVDDPEQGFSRQTSIMVRLEAWTPERNPKVSELIIVHETGR